MTADLLAPHDRAALEFLAEHGPDAPGVVNCEEVLSAHLVFLDLVERGLAEKEQGEDGPIYSISSAGLRALAAPAVPVLH